MVHQLRVLAALAEEDPGSVSGPLIVTPVPGDLAPPSGLLKHCMYMVYRHTCVCGGGCTHTHKVVGLLALKWAATAMVLSSDSGTAWKHLNQPKSSKQPRKILPRDGCIDRKNGEGNVSYVPCPATQYLTQTYLREELFRKGHSPLGHKTWRREHEAAGHSQETT